MSFLEKVSAREAETWAFTPDEVKDIARQADAEVERLRAELSKIKSAAGSEDPIALIEAAKELPRCHSVIMHPNKKVYTIEGKQWFVKPLNSVSRTADHADDRAFWSKFFPTPELAQLAREAKEKGDA